MKKICFGSCLLLFLFMQEKAIAQQKPLWQNSAFAVYADSIVQGKFTARILSDSAIVSNYQSPASQFISPDIVFKFSINGDDNEMKPGIDHHITCIINNTETPVIRFGKQFIDTTKAQAGQFLLPSTHLRIRVDMSEVLDAFSQKGYFETWNGTKIYKADFKGLFVAGATEPLMWDFDNLFRRPSLELKDEDGDKIYETTIILNEAKKENDLSSSWQLSADTRPYPAYQSPYAISDAIYNLSIEEMLRAIEPDSTFRTGKEWAGVWTRDISYSIILSMAYLQPRVAKFSLMKKVKNGRIIQDTGTGGAYPVSSDRMIWAVAAWELYKATGDKDWLQQSYEIIKNSIEDDAHNVYDKVTGMVRGESSFLDWREQTYPAWMQPADIFESENLGTNAVHYQANRVLAEMAALLNKPADEKRYKDFADTIRDGINKHLWMPGKGYYGQFLYGNTHKILSPRSEALGEALCVLFDIAKPAQQKSVIAKTPVVNFGIPCIYPQIPTIPPYHNNAVWPFVQAFWAQAAAKAGNETAVLQSIAAIYRPAALFLTNKENYVAADGDYKGTQINSSNMLWSLSGNISLVHKILFGIQFKADGIVFNPMVPAALKGTRTLNNFHYRNAILDIAVEGYGNKIVSFTLDDKILADPFISAEITGHHTIQIKLDDKVVGGFVNELKNVFSPETPVVKLSNKGITIAEEKPGTGYRLLRNGEDIQHNMSQPLPVEANDFSIYQAISIDQKGLESFASEPVVVPAKESSQVYEAEKFYSRAGGNGKGYSGEGFISISKQQNRTITIPITVDKDAVYSIDFRYANGNGPLNTENKCAIRTLKEGNKELGVIVFPQRGNDEWSNWGYSNPVAVYLMKGTHHISLSFENYNENMNGEINQAMLDYMRVTRIK